MSAERLSSRDDSVTALVAPFVDPPFVDAPFVDAPFVDAPFVAPCVTLTTTGAAAPLVLPLLSTETSCSTLRSALAAYRIISIIVRTQ